MLALVESTLEVTTKAPQSGDVFAGKPLETTIFEVASGIAAGLVPLNVFLKQLLGANANGQYTVDAHQTMS